MNEPKQPFYDGKYWNVELMAKSSIDSFEVVLKAKAQRKLLKITVKYSLLQYENKLYCLEATQDGFNAPYEITMEDWKNRNFKYFQIKGGK